MAEERQDLLASQELPTPGVAQPGVGEPRRHGITCNRGAMMSALSVFVALLVAGQAATVYYVVQQHGQITKLKDFTTEMKLKAMIEHLPKGHAAPPKQLRMAMSNKLLAFDDSDQQPRRLNLTKLESATRTSEKPEDHVKYFLAKDNPLGFYPEFNGTILENLKKLKEAMTDGEWKFFNAWLHHWLLFISAQNPPQEVSPAAEEILLPITEAPVMSKCQLDASERSHGPRLLGGFLPQCDDQGDYMPKQCHSSIGYCWCVYRNGTEIPGTKTRGSLECDNLIDPEGFALEREMLDDESPSV